MKPYSELTKEELLALKAELDAAFEDVKGKGMKLDMSRGKPATVQLDMAEGLLSAVSSNEDVYTENGTDCRNYGLLTGIPRKTSTRLPAWMAREGFASFSISPRRRCGIPCILPCCSL